MTSASAAASYVNDLHYPSHAHSSAQSRLAYNTMPDDHAPSTADDSDEPPSFFVRALYDFESNDASSLSFQKGALIEVLTQLESGWWDGLLHNQVRGWFPSNYVEPISDREAAVELAARAQLTSNFHLGLSSQPSADSDSFARLGFGSGFDGLQALIKGDGIGSSDAFSQLAEAAMLDPSRRVFDHNSPQLADAHSDASTYRNPSAPNHLAPESSASASLAALSTRARLLLSPLLPLPPALGPRAATGSNATDAWAQITSTSRGARTGAAANQLPTLGVVGPESGAESLAVANQPPSVLRSSSSGQSSTADAQHLAPDGSRTPSLRTNDSRPSSSTNSSHTAIFQNGSAPVRAPASNAVDRMPDPVTVPKPWKVRLTDDEKYFFFVHRKTTEIRWNYTDAKTKLTILSNVTPRSRSPAQPARSPASASTLNDHTKAVSSLGGSRSLAQEVSELNLDSDESDLDGDLNPRLPGKPPKMAATDAARSAHASLGAAAFAHHPALSQPQAAPDTLSQEELAAYDLQKAMAPSPVAPVSLLVRRANEVIRQLAAIATEQVGTNGLAESDGPLWSPQSGVYLPRLAHATSSVVSAIRDVLYATGSLSLSTSDLAAISKLVSASPAEADSRTALAPDSPLEHKDIGMNLLSSVLQASHASAHGKGASTALQRCGVYSKDSLALIPSSLHPVGRKLNAVVSKLVLSSRQVIDHTVTLASSPTSSMESTMTDLDADVFSKLYQCRQRLREDALELMRTLQSLSSEAEKVRSTALSAPQSRGWLRRVEGSLESDLGLNGIGATSFGSGMAASWLGNGFVLPSKFEVALIKAEGKGTRKHNPFDQRREAESAVVRGMLTLRRIPDKRFDQQVVEQAQKLSSQLEATNDAIGVAAKPAAAAQSALSLLSQYGAFEALIEAIDLASVLDVDGPSPGEAKSSSISARNLTNAQKARSLMRRLVTLKQTAYDLSCSLFIAVQEHGEESSTSIASSHLQREASRLTRLISTVSKTLEELVQVAEEQLRDASPYLGARAAVHGSEEGFSLPSTGIFSRKVNTTSNGLHEEVEEMSRYAANGGADAEEESEFMYLGPGIAVPNGPRARSGSRATTGSTGNSPSTSLAPARFGMSNSFRNRSTSVTTGGSSRSMQSYTDASSRILSRRGTLVDGSTAESIDEDSESVRTGGGKLRRLLGDDAPLTHTLTHDSENSAGTGNTGSTLARRKEDEVPWFLEPDYMGDDIVIAQDGSVKGATLEALLARLTMHNSFDASFNNTFLMTYRSFTTTQTLLDLLAQRFRILPPDGLDEDELALWTEKKQVPIRLRVFNVLKMWLEMHFYEGEDEPYLDQTAEVIREITIHQSTPYNLAVVPALEKYIETNLVDARSADDLYEQSLALEPREREDEKIARLLQESGFL
ncbi:hypothetical protein L1887_42467 [Cichorium endivia]|nr:hypothetical protein L1887_42467 [Cichorium endivia]